MGKIKLQAELGLDKTGAKKLFDEYHGKVPFVRQLSQDLIQFATENKLLFTLYDRFCRFNKWETTNKEWDPSINRFKPVKLYTLEEAKEAYKAEMYDQYKTGKLDPKPGDNTPARRKFLQRQAEDAEGSGDSRLFNLDEAEELEGLESLEKPIAEATAGRINYSKMAEMFPDVKLYGDESFDELLIIEKTGKHPRNKADGGRIGYAIGGLSEQGQNIYDSMTRAGFDEMAIAQALDEQQVAPEITTPGLQQEAVAPPRIQPILPINQGDSSGITTNINRSNPNFDYEFAALGLSLIHI